MSVPRPALAQTSSWVSNDAGTLTQSGTSCTLNFGTRSRSMRGGMVQIGGNGSAASAAALRGIDLDLLSEAAHFGLRLGATQFVDGSLGIFG
jgi:hypothetical protein